MRVMLIYKANHSSTKDNLDQQEPDPSPMKSNQLSQGP
jgi:hypothetical protein